MSKYIELKQRSMASVIADVSRAHEKIIKELVRVLYTPGIKRDEALKLSFDATNDILGQLIDREVNFKSASLSLLGYTQDEMAAIKTKLYSEWLRDYSSNPLYTLDKIRDQYGNVIGNIRDSFVRDRLYMSTPIASIQRQYVSDMNDLFKGDKLIKDVATDLNTWFENNSLSKHGYTIVNSETMNVYRSQEKIIQEDANLEYGIYYGGIRDTTRDFCLINVGVILSWQEWVDMTNDLGDTDITIYAGGYNCSHSVIAVDDALAKDAQTTLGDKYGATVADREAYKDSL